MKNKDMDKLRNDIREELEDTGLTQKQLAELAGVDPMTVSKTLTGKTRPQQGTVAKLCRALDLDQS